MAIKVHIRCPKCKDKFEYDLADVVVGGTGNCSLCGATVVFTEKTAKQVRDAVERVIGKTPGE